MRIYAISMRGKLVQTTIKTTTLRELDALARACGHKRSSYLRHLIELHVRSLPPKLAKTMMGDALVDQEILEIATRRENP